ncbi:MAG: M28 family peptidase, partial [Pseudohongiellaceae bacterium]
MLVKPIQNLGAMLATVLVAVLVSGNATAAESTAWFGVTQPTGMGDRHAPAVDIRQASPRAATVPPEESGFVDLQGENIFPMVDRIVGFSRESLAEGNRVWGRVTGFPSAQRTLEWVAQEFRSAGLQDVALQEYNSSGEFWWPHDWEVRLLGNEVFGPGSMDVVLESSLVTAGSEISGGSLVASPVFTGRITEPVADTDIRGKIAVQLLTPQTGAYSDRTPTRERAQALMAKGAVAVINIVEQVGNMHTRDFSNCNGPCFNVGTDDGRFLRTVMEQAEQLGLQSQLQLRLSLDAATLTGLKGHNTVGIVDGTGSGNIIINAHADGWYDAAGDNADGLAVLIAMARHFALPANRQPRTLVFVASGGHHSP